MKPDPFAQPFEPAPSAGWAWLLALTLLCVLPFATLFLPGAVEPDEVIALWITLGVMVPLVGFFVITLLSLPRMRYEVGTEMLRIRCGPFLDYSIPYAEITDMRRATLTPSPWSSMRLPGLALWGVVYPREGTVYMCATRMSRDLLLIRTAKRRYGITPANEQAFVRAVMPKMPRGQGSTPSDEGVYYSAGD